MFLHIHVGPRRVATLDEAPWSEEKHKRASNGQFGSGGGGATAASTGNRGALHREFRDRHTPAEWSAKVLHHAKTIAKTLKFPEEMLSIAPEDKKLELNGKNYSYAGHCELATGKCVLYPTQLMSDRVVKSVTAHEIMHAKFENLRNAKDKEFFSAMQRSREMGGGMFVDGKIKKEYADEYPLLKFFDSLDQKELAKSDGVTEYSRAWWKAYEDKKATFWQATHETLAEMAAVRFENGETPIPDKTWKALFVMSREEWKRSGPGAKPKTNAEKTEAGRRDSDSGVLRSGHEPDNRGSGRAGQGNSRERQFHVPGPGSGLRMHIHRGAR